MTVTRSDIPQQMYLPANYVIGAGNQAPVLVLPTNTIIAAPGLTAGLTAVPHAADAREISEQEFRSEVGKHSIVCHSPANFKLVS